jgi:hypothetical protein
MNKKHFSTNLPLVIAIVASGFLPILLLGNIKLVEKFLNLDTSNSVLLITTIIPISFSVITLLIPYLFNKIKNERNKVNGQIISYNTIILKCVGLFNNLMNHTFYIDNCIKELSNNKEFIDIINIWKKGTADKIDYSNDLRQIIKPYINNIIYVYFNSNMYDNNIQYLSNIKVQNITHEVTIEDKIFLFSLRNFITFTDEDKKLLGIFSDLWSNGNIYKNAVLELMEHIGRLERIFENEIRNRNISDKKLSTILYDIILSFLHYMEILYREIMLLDLFMEKLIKNFLGYYESVHRTHKILDEMIKPVIEITNENIENYVNIDVLYEYYRIKTTHNEDDGIAVYGYFTTLRGGKIFKKTEIGK